MDASPRYKPPLSLDDYGPLGRPDAGVSERTLRYVWRDAN
jgi:hypothetical protein